MRTSVTMNTESSGGYNLEVRSRSSFYKGKLALMEFSVTVEMKSKNFWVIHCMGYSRGTNSSTVRSTV